MIVRQSLNALSKDSFYMMHSGFVHHAFLYVTTVAV